MSSFPRVFPEWNLDAAFIALHINDAMLLDNKLSSHPVEVDCPDANKINQAGLDTPTPDRLIDGHERFSTHYPTQKQLPVSLGIFPRRFSSTDATAPSSVWQFFVCWPIMLASMPF